MVASVNQVAARSIIGAIVHRNELIERVRLSVDDFTDRRHQIIWRTFLELWNSRLAIDYVTVESKISPELWRKVGSEFVECATGKFELDNVEHYAEIVSHEALTQRARLALSEIASNQRLDGPEILVAAQRAIALLQPANAGEIGMEDTYCLHLDKFLGSDEPTEEEEQAQWLVRGFLARNAANLFVGGPKSMKTLIAMHMSICIAAGMDWLGHRVAQGSVLFLAHEDPKFETRRRLWRLSRGLGLDPRSLGANLVVRDRALPFHYDEPPDIERMKRTFDFYKPDVLFVDSLSRAHRKEENSTSEMKSVTDLWMDLATKYRVAICNIHHTNKTTGLVRGAGEIFAAARHMVSFAKKDGVVQITTDGNMAFTPEPFAVEVKDTITHEGHKAITLAIGMEAAKVEQLHELDQRILEHLRTNGPAYTGDIKTALKAKSQTVTERLNLLCGEGKIGRPSTRHKWNIRQ